MLQDMTGLLHCKGCKRHVAIRNSIGTIFKLISERTKSFALCKSVSFILSFTYMIKFRSNFESINKGQQDRETGQFFQFGHLSPAHIQAIQQISSTGGKPKQQFKTQPYLPCLTSFLSCSRQCSATLRTVLREPGSCLVLSSTVTENFYNRIYHVL